MVIDSLALCGCVCTCAQLIHHDGGTRLILYSFHLRCIGIVIVASWRWDRIFMGWWVNATSNWTNFGKYSVFKLPLCYFIRTKMNIHPGVDMPFNWEI